MGDSPPLGGSISVDTPANPALDPWPRLDIPSRKWESKGQFSQIDKLSIAPGRRIDRNYDWQNHQVALSYSSSNQKDNGAED